jgi:integrase
MNAHTSRARAAAKRDYFAFLEKAGTADLSAWVSDMHARGLAANTIRQRIYLLRAWLGADPSVPIPARRAIHERKWLDVEQVRALLSVIPRHETGRRDFALLAALLVSGQRVGQVRMWRWRDIQQKTVPQVICDAAQAIPARAADSHPATMPPSLGNAHVFSTPKRSLGLTPNREIVPVESIQPPVSPQEINRRIRRYARLAGLESEGISAESLRFTHRQLGEYTVTMLVQEALEARVPRPIRWKKLEHDTRLHGIGRRRRS